MPLVARHENRVVAARSADGMVNHIVEYVHRHPPRCIKALCPRPSSETRPAIGPLPPLQAVEAGVDSASFTIGCPCGNRGVCLLGYWFLADGRAQEPLFVSPFRLLCLDCGLVLEFFDTRKHGYDGEQGVNTYIVGEGEPDMYVCPRCGARTFVLRPIFWYQSINSMGPNMRERFQDYFDTFELVGQCMECKGAVGIASFECA